MTFSANKFVNRMFRRVANVVWDPMSGGIGLKTNDGVYTLAVDEEGAAQVTVNPLDLSVALPAFALNTKIEQVEQGDVIVGSDRILGWAIDKTASSIKLLDTNGMTKNYTPPKVAVLGQDGVLVVKNLFSVTGGEGGFQQMLPMLMMFGGEEGKLEKVLPFMLMGQMNQAGGQAAANPMASMLPLLLMKEGGLGGGKIDPMMLMAMSGGFGTGANPMLMMALAGGLEDAPANVHGSAPVNRVGLPALSSVEVR